MNLKKVLHLETMPIANATIIMAIATTTMITMMIIPIHLVSADFIALTEDSAFTAHLIQTITITTIILISGEAVSIVMDGVMTLITILGRTLLIILNTIIIIITTNLIFAGADTDSIIHTVMATILITMDTEMDIIPTLTVTITTVVIMATMDIMEITTDIGMATRRHHKTTQATIVTRMALTMVHV